MIYRTDGGMLGRLSGSANGVDLNVTGTVRDPDTQVNVTITATGKIASGKASASGKYTGSGGGYQWGGGDWSGTAAACPSA